MVGRDTDLKIKVLVSVYNISGYLIAELEELSKYAELAVIETPCGIPKGELTNRAKWIDRTRYSSAIGLAQALGEFKPDVFLCGGWADKQCLGLAKVLHKKGARTVLLVDTPWQGRMKQVIHCLYSRFYLTTIFDFAWCAGAPQERYLRYLGFPLKRIRRGYYCADTKKFAPIGAERLGIRKEELGTSGEKAVTREWPHVFLYIGRYVAVKNMRRMEWAFVKAVEKVEKVEGAERIGKKPWVLRCIGGGELWDERTIHPRIEHLGYKSPDEIQDYVRDAGCFVLPSVYEPWGVVVHEAALMGLPMLCSNQIQAATAYLREGENGFSFDPFDEDAMTEAFLKIMRSSDAELAMFGRASVRLGLQYTTEDWVKRAVEFAR